MKLVLVSLLILIPALVLAGCSEQVQDNQASVEAAQSPEATPTAGAQASDVWKGEILETMNSGGYSYIKFMKDGEEIWVAGPEAMGLEVGKEVEMSPGMLMSNFHAKSLNRDFAEIYFVGSLGASGQGAAEVTNPHGGTGMGMGGMGDPPGGGSSAAVENTSVEPVQKAEGGLTVSEIYGKSQELAGKRVLVRGQVVKFSPNIMNTNWLHIQDGSADGATGDLTVTTSARVSVGDIVLVEGPLSVEKDFGAGYKYAVIIEGASVTKE